MWILNILLAIKKALLKFNAFIYKTLQNNNYSSTVLGDAQYIPYYHGRINWVTMDLENTQVQMRKGILEYCILHIIARGEVYASNMLDELTAAKMIVVEGTLYPLLTRLKNAGLLEYKWVESKSGPPRKYYKLTDKGAKFLEKLTETWDELIHSTEMITSRSNAKS